VLSRKIANPMKKANSAIDAPLNGLLVNRSRSINGCGCRSVRSTVTAMTRAATTSRDSVEAEPHPQDGPCTVPSTSKLTEASTSTEETRSGSRLPAAARTSGSTFRPPTRVAMPIGTLIRKIHRQDASTSSPPTGGPAVPATAATPAQMPTTMACCRFAKAGYSSPSEVGTIRDAPTAWTARAATSRPSEGAAAHAAEAKVNTATPTSRNRRRPK